MVVTGGAGFIGARLVRAAPNVLRVLLGPPGTAPPPGLEDLDTATGWIDDESVAAAVVSGADAVVHLAGPPSVAASFADPVGTTRAHVVGTAAIAAACVAGGVRRLVVVSSAEVYGPRHDPTPVAEHHPTGPTSPYGAAKSAAEIVATTLTQGSDTSLVVLRPFSVYGPGARPDGLVPTVVGQAAHAEQICVHDLAPVRDLVHVDDVVGALLAALTVPVEGPTPLVCNVGSGVGVSVGDLCRLARRVAGRGGLPIVERGSDRPTGASVPALVADTSRAAAALGWRATTSLADGLGSLVAAPAGEVAQP